MPWTVKYDSALDIVKVIFLGHVLSDELRAAAIERIRVQNESRTSKILVDTTGIEQLFAGIMDVFALPNELYVSQKADRMSRMALIIPKNPKAKETGHFFETACLNRGWMVRIFDESQEAISWLQGAPTSSGRAKASVYNFT